MSCRKSARRNLAVNILIYCRDIGYIQGSIRDIAPEGMCIDMRPVLLPDDALVELVVTVPGDKGERFYRVAAFVAHAADGMVGLIFHKRDDVNVRCLLRAIADAALTAQAGREQQYGAPDSDQQVLRA